MIRQEASRQIISRNLDALRSIFTIFAKHLLVELELY